jgi:hypothetical protein
MTQGLTASLALVGISLVSGASLAAPSPTSKAALLPGADRNDCFLVRFSKDRRVLDDKHLIVWANGEIPYLVELDRPLHRLSSGGHSIAFVDGDRDGQVCRTLRDKIVVLDTIASKSRRIVGVTSLDADQIRALEAKYETSLARKKRGQRGGDKQNADQESAQDESTEPVT